MNPRQAIHKIINLLEGMENAQVNNQWKWEIASWKRTLEFLLTENAYLKTQVAELAGQPMHTATDLEHFLSRFLQQEEVIQLMKKELRDCENLLHIVKTSIQKESLQLRRNKFKNDMDLLETKFKELVQEFKKRMSAG